MKNLVNISIPVLAILAGCTMPQQEFFTKNEPNREQSRDSALASTRLVGIEIKSDGVISSGSGVWLGEGRVLTATHIFSGMKSPSDPIFVTWGDQKLKATPIFHGAPPENDLILLKVDRAAVPASLAKVSSPQVCNDVEPIGQRVYVTARDRTYWTYTSPEGMITHKQKKWSNATTALFSHGVSGSPLYNDDSGCLAGIISRMEFGSNSNLADPKQAACQRATIQMADAHQGVTCAIQPKTVFMTAETIQDFLKEAKEYERNHPTE